jgi:hypothetical protein
MTSLPDFVQSELDLIEIPIGRIVRLLGVPSWDEDQITAFGTYVQNVYTGIERILQYLLKERGEDLPKSSTWHYSLLKLSCSCGLAPSEVGSVLENLMKYRHRHIHGYGHMLDEPKLRELATPIPETFNLFRRHISNWIDEK